MSEWPLVDKNDDGIRPAGKPDECFYCGNKIGHPHGLECVIVTKKVKLRYIYEIEVDIPHNWDDRDILFHRNDGSWCADNSINELKVYIEENGCLCGIFNCEFICVTDETPKRKLKENPNDNNSKEGI